MIEQPQIDKIMAKIEIKGTAEELYRVSIFLENNFIKHTFNDNVGGDDLVSQELEEAIDWTRLINDF